MKSDSADKLVKISSVIKEIYGAGLCEKTLIPNPRGEDRGVPIRTTAAHGLCCSWICFLGG